MSAFSALLEGGRKLVDPRASGGAVADISTTRIRSSLLLVIYTTIIIAIGGCGNAVLIVVHVKRKNVFNRGKLQVLDHFVFVMAILDFLVCVVILPIQVWTLMTQYRNFPDAACKFFAFGRLFAVYASMFVLVAIAWDRFVSVCRPFSTALAVTLTRARRITGYSSAAAALLAAPNLYAFKIVNIGRGQSVVMVCQPDEYSPTGAQVSAIIFLGTFVFYVVCVVAMIILHIIVFRNLQDRKEKRIALAATLPGIEMENGAAKTDTLKVEAPPTRRNSVAKRVSEATTKTVLMLLLVTAVVILSWVPYWTAMIPSFLEYYAIVDYLYQEHILQIVGASYYINNAANPIIYTFVNPILRKEILEVLGISGIFGCWKEEEDPAPISGGPRRISSLVTFLNIQRCSAENNNNVIAEEA